MKDTISSLKEAIIGESHAKRTYQLFSEQAKKENLNFIAHIFKAISLAEDIHIKNHLKALSVITNSEVKVEEIVKIDEDEIKKKVKNTRSNLYEAIQGETYETKKMYKEFVKNAKNEGLNVAELSFTLAKKAEKVHAKIYSDLLKKLEKNKTIESKEVYVCQICGNIEFEIEKLEICPVCEHGIQFFKKV